MIPILLFILQSLSAVLCLNCSDVRKSKGFGIYTRRKPNGERSNWIYDKNGREWKFNLKEKNGEMVIESIGKESLDYGLRVENRFSNYFEYGKLSVAYNCYIPINSHRIVCDFVSTLNDKREISTTDVDLDIENPVVFKTYPKSVQDYYGRQMMAYNKHNKSERVGLEMLEIGSRSMVYNIVIRKDNLPDLEFIEDMNYSLFRQIDSMLDYNWDYERGLTGHMLWFNINYKYYYCFQTGRKVTLRTSNYI